MKAPDLPQNELIRLKTLKSLNVLDTAAEERFDRLTRMAKRLFGVPIALVSLVDENRQWFKSCIGLDVSETSREISFCGHAILEDGIFLIDDTEKDNRFSDNPLVLNPPFIRFYAGCPLTVHNQRLGTLCIIDQRPRQFSEEDLLTLKDLAIMVEKELEAVQIATLDELTRVSNRRGFMTLAQKGLNICNKQEIPSALALFDLNGFKQINDTFGHSEGDIALISFANIIQENCREVDVFGRLGGDEFALWLSDASDDRIGKIFDRFRSSINKYNQEKKRGYDLSFSVGWVTVKDDWHITVEDLIAKADLLMYEQKKKHK